MRRALFVADKRCSVFAEVLCRGILKSRFRAVFTLLWQACACPESLKFDRDGRDVREHLRASGFDERYEVIPGPG